MKNALIAAVVAMVVAAGSAGAALTRSHIRVVRVVGSPVTVAAGGSGFAWAACPGHLKASGGGLTANPFSTNPVQIEASYATTDVSTWEIVVSNPNSTPAAIQAVAVCVG